MNKTVTEKQLQANRANAQKSTGPKTPRGKQVCSKNAIKHGFLAQTVLLPGENRKSFIRLHDSYVKQFQPQTQDEHDLVDTLAANRWRLLRNWGFESAGFIHDQRQHADLNAGKNAATQAMLARRNMDNPPRSQESLSRHESRLDRQYYKAWDRLRRILAERLERAECAEEQGRLERAERAEEQGRLERAERCEKQERTEGAERAENARKAQENEKNPQQTHHVQQNKLLHVLEHPIEIPKESQTIPEEDPLDPIRNPLAA